MSSTATEPIAVPQTSEVSLDASLVHGIAWTSGMKWLAQLLTWVCTIAVARLLTPADYGLVGMALLYLEFVTVISELGLGAAVVTHHALSRHQIAQLNSLSVLLGLGAFLVSCAAAIPLSIFFGVPELRWVVLAMSLSSVVTSLRAVPSALLERELQFKTLAVVEGIQAVVSAVSVLILALLGFHYWSLVIGAILSRVVWTGLVLTRRSHSFAWPHFRALRDSITFGSHLLVSRLSWYAQANSHFLVTARVFGREMLGAYSMGFTIASLPTEKITAIVGQVAFPFFSSIQNNPAALRRYLLSLTKGLALLTFPLALGLATVSGELVLGVLGPKWEAAIVPLRCLAFLMLFQGIFPLLPNILNVTGESRFAMRVGIVAAVVLPFAFYVGTRWGTLGVAAMWITVYPALSLPLYWRVFKRLELSAAAYLKVLWPAFSASMVMVAAVWALKLTLPPGWAYLTRLALEVGTGGVVYGLFLLAVYRDELQNFRRALAAARTPEVASHTGPQPGTEPSAA